MQYSKLTLRYLCRTVLKHVWFPTLANSTSDENYSISADASYFRTTIRKHEIGILPAKKEGFKVTYPLHSSSESAPDSAIQSESPREAMTTPTQRLTSEPYRQISRALP